MLDLSIQRKIWINTRNRICQNSSKKNNRYNSHGTAFARAYFCWSYSYSRVFKFKHSCCEKDSTIYRQYVFPFSGKKSRTINWSIFWSRLCKSINKHRWYCWSSFAKASADLLRQANLQSKVAWASKVLWLLPPQPFCLTNLNFNECYNLRNYSNSEKIVFLKNKLIKLWRS